MAVCLRVYIYIFTYTYADVYRCFVLIRISNACILCCTSTCTCIHARTKYRIQAVDRASDYKIPPAYFCFVYICMYVNTHAYMDTCVDAHIHVHNTQLDGDCPTVFGQVIS